MNEVVRNSDTPLNKEHDRLTVEAVDVKAKALATGLEFVKRCFEAQTLDDIFYLFTNDIRSLLPFDRSILVTHLGGRSKFAAAGNQPNLEPKSKFYQSVSLIAESFASLKKAVLFSGKGNINDEDLPESTKKALQELLDICGSSYLLCIPLIHHDKTVAHIIMDFLDGKPPDQIGVLTVLNISPFLAAALSDRWILSKKPDLIALLDPQQAADSLRQRTRRMIKIGGLISICLIFIVFILPFPFEVGGEAEIVPTDKYVAFCKIEGLIERVDVAEGATVRKDQVLAVLDPRELDYKIKAAEKQFEIFTSEKLLLQRSGGEDPSKLAESALADMKRKAAWEELQFLVWQKQFLEIKSPVSGIVITKDVETLAGKKLRPGEPFCEIAVPSELSVEVLVPDDRVMYVAKEQSLTFYLAGDPWKGYNLKVHEIAPASEAIPRLGNVYRVRALFSNAPSSTMVGMRGIGKIYVKNESLWFIVSDRLLSRWQRASLYF